ncbi:MAG: hypothetical protein L0G46_07995 [Kocuria sp.]|nr:hypothetical protein [Kocuria sp.]
MRKKLAASAATGLATSAAIGAVAATLGGYSIARAVTEPYSGRRFSTPVRAISSHNGRPVVVLDDDAQTRRRGLYGGFLPDGTHVQFGTEALPWGSAVARTIPPEAAGRMSAIDHLSWTGIHFPTPESAGLEAENIDLDSDVGAMPAWLVPGRSRRQWAIHVHGMGSTRAGTLRGVQVATSLGLTSLAVSYRNSPEGAGHRSGAPPWDSTKPTTSDQPSSTLSPMAPSASSFSGGRWEPASRFYWPMSIGGTHVSRESSPTPP